MPFADEIVNRLVAQGVGTKGTQVGVARSLYQGSRVAIPSTDGPLLIVVETGGSGPAMTQNDTATQRPTAQLSVRGTSATAVRSMLKDAYDALGGANGLHNVTLSGTYYLDIIPRQEPTDIGEDATGRAQFAFNIEAEKEPS